MPPERRVRDRRLLLRIRTRRGNRGTRGRMGPGVLVGCGQPLRRAAGAFCPGQDGGQPVADPGALPVPGQLRARGPVAVRRDCALLTRELRSCVAVGRTCGLRNRARECRCRVDDPEHIHGGRRDRESRSRSACGRFALRLLEGGRAAVPLARAHSHSPRLDERQGKSDAHSGALSLAREFRAGRSAGFSGYGSFLACECRSPYTLVRTQPLWCRAGPGRCGDANSEQLHGGANIGNLEVVARSGGAMFHYWREDVPPYRWFGPSVIPASGTTPGFPLAAGTPSLRQNRNAATNFELVTPLADGGLAHYSRANGIPGSPWFGPAVVGANLGRIDAVSLIQSTFSLEPSGVGNLELVAQAIGQLFHFWLDNPVNPADEGFPWNWFGPWVLTE